jgi:protein-S-isoprenylcysteine O-methyltransferase Ste14
LPPDFSPVLILFTMAVWGGIHSLLASQSAKDLARHWFGDKAERGYRLWYNLFSVVSFLPVLALVVILPDRVLYSIPFPWLILTLSIQAAALLALLVGLRQTGLSTFLGLRQLLATRAESQSPMIVDGLYRWVRHPLYSAGLVFIWLLPVMTLNILALNIGLSAYLVIGALFEERRLVREYGEAYITYRQQTPMLVPHLPGKAKPVKVKEG